jgi:hypothetical protein
VFLSATLLIYAKSETFLKKYFYVVLAFDDVNVEVKCLVIQTNDNKAIIKFIDMPDSIANKLTYHYMKSAAHKLEIRD